MDFSLTDDRRMLADTLARYLADQYPIEHRNTVAYAAPFHDPAKWAELAELGVIGALVPEAKGGFGGTGFDIAVVFEALGRALCPEPMLAALMGLTALSHTDQELDPIIAGETRIALATGELDAPYSSSDIATTATGDRLTGRKSVVYGGGVADTLLVTARHGAGIGLYQVAASDTQITPFGMVDGGGAAEVFLDNTPATRLLADAGPALAHAETAGIVALCAEAVGVMEVLKDQTLDYLKTRKQFGRAIGDFQVLQHRMVDLTIEIEQARSITIQAADSLGTPHGPRHASMAKNLIGRAGKLVSEEAIQLHGGIAMTWEYPVSHYAKRLIMIDHQLGDTDTHLERVIAG
ncbi:acyl-CoA dehydrogenase family protein [Actibacterium sp. 188UL27-1]|uniref:acyl-CoA dehydrogenase family protein n=1 Tax=Actibacterium sp. 188UL27-1 TaxID=2786961 RepID=UPI0019576625|nr:acyl-CoA dehydrogenase [Actibacterium sp. 188UL27-1]MBM7069645.1 acyl-CoA dehydrogenase family protein [Actibacterium sp. 188UL27-1]